MIFFLFETWVLRFILIYFWKYFFTMLFSFLFSELIDIRFGFYGFIVYYPIFFSDHFLTIFAKIAKTAVFTLFNLYHILILLLSTDQKLAWNLV